MFCLSKKVDYALTALAYLAERPERVASAREISRILKLPGALLMNILKQLQQREILQSTRGVKGGYKIACDLRQVSLFDLMRFVECEHGKADHEAGPEGQCACDDCKGYELQLARSSSQGPVQALHFKLIRFLKDVKLSDLVLPGQRIDVPLDGLGFSKKPARVALV